MLGNLAVGGPFLDASQEVRPEGGGSRDRQKGRMGEAGRGRCSGEWVSTSNPGVMAP